MKLPDSKSGFTLVEMAMVLIVMGLVMLAVLPALTALRSGTSRTTTQTNLQALMTATASYVQANGCLPCPANASLINGAFGLVGTPANAACGTCAVPEGIPPFMSLGIPASTAHDGWGHWVTMRVDPALTTNFGVVPPTKPCTCTGNVGGPCTPSAPACTCAVINTICTATAASIQGMCAANLASDNRINVLTPAGSTQQAAVIFVSHGVSGFGSFLASVIPLKNGALNGTRLGLASLAACTNFGGFARCNADGDNNFVDAPPSGATADPYDDILTFASRNMIVSMLGNTSCQTVW